MASSYTYPHTNVTVNALQRRKPVAVESTATTLLAPFTCDRGPENELVAIDRLSDFYAIFGYLDYCNPDQRQILNIGQWLTNGGRVLACRITDVDATSGNAKKATGKGTVNVPDTGSTTITYEIDIEARYSGTYYNGLGVNISSGANGYDVEIKKGNTVLEKYRSKSLEELLTIGNTSMFLGSIAVYKVNNDPMKNELIMENKLSLTTAVNITLSDGADVTSTNTEGYLSEFTVIGTGDTATRSKTTLHTALSKILEQPLETQFDCMIDCGYIKEVKEDLINLFCTGTTETVTKQYSTGTRTISISKKRDDAFLYLSEYEIKGNGRFPKNDVIKKVTLTVNAGQENTAILNHCHKVDDIYSYGHNNREVFATTGFFIAALVPYNDAKYGTQWPTAGTNRGVISGSKWIDMVPTNKEKQEYYDKNLNYIERDTRGMYIMTQLTATNEDTELKFISKERSLLKMKKQLSQIGRSYLHEFNDRITKNNLLNKLNSTMAEWIKNRTLSFALVELEDYTQNDTLTNEELLIKLEIKFTGTVEIISTEITVD